MAEESSSAASERAAWARHLIKAYRPYNDETSRTPDALCRHVGRERLWREMFAAAASSRDRDVEVEVLAVLSKEILDIAADAGIYQEAAEDTREVTWYERNVRTLIVQWRKSYDGMSQALRWETWKRNLRRLAERGDARIRAGIDDILEILEAIS